MINLFAHKIMNKNTWNAMADALYLSLDTCMNEVVKKVYFFFCMRDNWKMHAKQKREREKK